MKVDIGKQLNGSSEFNIKDMALKACYSLKKNFNELTAADVGSGGGDFTRIISKDFKKVFALDSFNSTFEYPNIEEICCDLNEDWPLNENSVDFLFSLEVIEHLENPRHFFRQVNQVLKRGGFCFISTPNNLSVYSRIIFLVKGEHRYFQDASYPGHITPILHKDIKRITSEIGFEILKWYYTNSDKLPFVKRNINLPGKFFSKNFGVLLIKS